MRRIHFSTCHTPMRVILSQRVAVLAMLAVILCSRCCPLAFASSVWKTGSGDWNEVSRWGGALPDPRATASIEGNSRVILSRGDVMLSQLNVGAYHSANATCVMDGGNLTLSELLRLGETTARGWQIHPERRPDPGA